MGTRTTTSLSLFSGYGGLERGVAAAIGGARAVCMVEREAFAIANMVAQMEAGTLAQAPIWTDVTTFDGKPWRGRVDILTAGYPCQPFSFSGRRRGHDDPRHLWPQVERIIGEVRPEWVFCENVEGHITLGAAEVFDSLRALGYSPKAGLFSALEAGASQLRRRLFIVAHADEVPLREQLRGGAVGPGDEAPGRSGPGGEPDLHGKGCSHLDADLAPDPLGGSRADADHAVGGFAPPPSDFAAWAAVLDRRPDLQPELFGLGDGMADRLDRSDAAGNGVVSLAAAYAWRTLRAAHDR